jgi:hypothetical protein
MTRPPRDVRSDAQLIIATTPASTGPTRRGSKP